LGRHRRALWLAVPAAIAAAAVALPIGASSGQSGNQYTQTNLISDIPGVARITDPNLVNPWGLSDLPGSPIWVADNGTNKSTLYSGAVDGSIPTIVPLVVKIQGGAPTGTVGNDTGSSTDFIVHTAAGSAPANFIFDSESGRITAWSGAVSGTTAQTVFGPRDTAVYKGLALAQIGDSNFLFAANFRAGTVDVFNGQFKLQTLPAGAFTDPNIPAGFAPFGIQFIGNSTLLVSYAKQDAAKHDDVAGAGRGFIDKYSTSGVLLQRLVTRGALNSPWGMAIAPDGFGGFSGDLIVGNFGNGAVNAYDPSTGALLGPLTNTDGHPIVINGLWGLRFGDGRFGSTSTLVFAAGIGDESHGLLGEISPAG